LVGSVERFTGTRAAHADETGEDYVEAIAQLIDAGNSGARVTALAQVFGVSHVTVVRALGRLRTRGLVEGPRGKPVTLTAAGRALAERAQERHETVLRFLRAIGVPARQAALDAEGIEHHVSDQTIAAMCRIIQQRTT
jgi:DtxR family transcriptional regulator, manganese transport regulator